MGKNDITVSVLLVTYNADWDKLRMTLESILLQKDVSFEVVIADDGSKIRWDEQIIALCQKHNFEKYHIANSPQNVGTCRNLYHALQQASGRYVKAISPGDFLFNEYSLKKWCEFMDTNPCAMTFGDAVYYAEYDSEKGIQMVQTKNAPVSKNNFGLKQKRRSVFVDYMLANDTILGATIMMTRDSMQLYLGQILDKVIYAEDYMVRLMVLQGERILYYPENVIWYEYGTGISTSQNSTWAERLLKDFEGCNNIIQAYEKYPDKIAEKYAKYLRDGKGGLKGKLLKLMTFPDMLYWRMKMRCSDKTTSIPTDTRFAECVMKANNEENGR